MRFGCRLTACIVVLAAALPVDADPWLDPGDSGLRHDLQLLADGGVIGVPMTQWPMSWGDIELDDTADRMLSPAEQAAFGRVMARLRQEQRGGWRPAAAAAAGGDGLVVRSFQDTPRSSLELGLGANWLGDRIALRGRAQYINDAEDGDEWRLDDSYAAVALGNWAFSFSATDRYWGPSWQSSLFLSNNGRPIPAIAIDRNLTTPFESKWLSWIGHWDLVALFGFLGRGSGGAGCTVFRPARNNSVRQSGWKSACHARPCGAEKGGPAGLDTFVDLLLGRDNAGDNVSAEDEPGNQIAGYDIRLTGAGFGVPVAVYVQRAGEDERDFLPQLYMTQIGAEHWGGFDNGVSYRVYGEITDTLCGGNITGPGTPDTCYNHPIYETGMRFRGRTIGYSADNDSELVTLGGLLNLNDESSLMLNTVFGELNRVENPDLRNSITADPLDYIGVNLFYQRSLPVGELRASVGYESFEGVILAKDDNWRGFVEWRVDW